MLEKTHSRILLNVDRNEVWDICSQIGKWAEWDFNIINSSLDGTIEKRARFRIHHRKFPKAKGHISEYIKGKELVLEIPMLLGKVKRRYTI